MEKEKGFSLLEVMLAIALMGIIAVAFLGALATGSRAIFIADERATAESLARSQMEYVKNLPYDDINTPPAYTLLPESDIPEGYGIDISAERLDPKEDGTVNLDGSVNDDGIQKITVMIYHPEEEIEENKVITLEDYKVNR
jgi:prepilin-type N-terminal cleavage/methylation domain-containing protein